MIVDELDIDVEASTSAATLEVHRPIEHIPRSTEDDIDRLMSRTSMNLGYESSVPSGPIFGRRSMDLCMGNDFPIWTGDSSARRSPEGIYIFYQNLFCLL